MFLAFCMGLATSRCGLRDIDRVQFRVTESRVKKIEKCWQDEIRPIVIHLKNTKLSVYFRHDRTSQFFDT